MPPIPTKPNRKSSASEKLEIVARVKCGESLNSLERKSGYQRSQIKKWMSKENDLIKSQQRNQKRVKGGGRKPAFPEIEKLVMEWFKKQRETKVVINYNMFRREAEKVSESIRAPSILNHFCCSNKWIRGVCHRNNITTRKINNQNQEDNYLVNQIYTNVHTFMREINQKTVNISKKFIFNMDEIPCYFDMGHSGTLYYQGEKTEEGLATGHLKNRFTIVLCISAAGIQTRTQIILKGLKKVPTVKLPKNIDLVVSDGGSMTTDLMINKWIDNCFKPEQNSLLIMDSYGCHLKEEIAQNLKQFNIETVIIPRKTTFLQPLDVTISYQFKHALRTEWNNWLIEGPEEYTSNGSRKKPSYQNLVDFTAAALKTISPKIIIRSFECCGIGEQGEKIPLARLNEKLQAVLATGQTLFLESKEEEENFDEEYELILGDDLPRTYTDELLSPFSSIEDNLDCEIKVKLELD